MADHPAAAQAWPHIRIGCAGWGLHRDLQASFAEGGSHLQRYASRFDAAEINSSFRRPHRRSTYERWAAQVPPRFRFSVKLPRTVSHERQLVDCDSVLTEFLAQVAGLGDRLGCLLVQLPPALAFDAAVARAFFDALQERHDGPLALEPRHATWFTPAVDGWLAQRAIARVLADPVRYPAGASPGGAQDMHYLRLHGSPRIYYSSYDSRLLAALARRIVHALEQGRTLWCIFDNTASDAAIHNAIELQQAVERLSGPQAAGSEPPAPNRLR